MGDTTNLWADAQGWAQPQYYTTIQGADIDGDGQAELMARSASGIQVAQLDTNATTPDVAEWRVLPAGPNWSDAEGWAQPQYYTTIQTADIDGDGQAELMARSAFGITVFKCDKTSHTWTPLPAGPNLSDAEGWNQPQYYTTIQTADIDGDGQAELLARSIFGISAWKCNKASHTWTQLPNGPNWSDVEGWNQPQYYSTIKYADINGDRRAELLARAAQGIIIFSYFGSWTQLGNGPNWSDAEGWNQPQYYSTIQYVNVGGSAYGAPVPIARSAGGMVVALPTF